MDNDIAEKIDGFFRQFRNKVYKKGEILIRADDEPSGVFYLKEGVVKQYAISRKGDELVINIFKPIAFFPMSWAINKSQNDYYFEALSELEVWQAPREAVVEFIKANPDVLFNLMSRVYRGVDGVLRRMTYLMAGSAYYRLVTEIIIHAKRFGGQKAAPAFDGDKAAASSGGNTELKYELTISEKDIAAQSGMTRETVSREMKKLKDKGLVSFDKKVLTIHDLTKLEDELLGTF